jgi:aminodeoxyfutalosine deaminase
VVTLNTDDPAMFGTSLEEEFLRSARIFGLSRQTLTELCGNAIQASFLDEGGKQLLRRELERVAESGADSVS